MLPTFKELVVGKMFQYLLLGHKSPPYLLYKAAVTRVTHDGWDCLGSTWGSVVPQDAAPDAAPSCPGDAEGLGSGRLERLCLSMNAGRRALCLVSDDFSNKGGGLLPGLVRANERAKAASSRVGWELAASCLPRCGYSESGSAQVYHVLSLHKGG